MLKNIIVLFIPILISSCLHDSKPAEPKRETFSWSLSLQMGDVKFDSLTQDTSMESYQWGDTIFGEVHYEAGGLVRDSLYLVNQYNGRQLVISLADSKSFSVSHLELFGFSEGRFLLLFKMIDRLTEKERGSILTKDPSNIQVMIDNVFI